MFGKFILATVPVKVRRPSRKHIDGAVKTLDIQIMDFQDRAKEKKSYRSPDALIEISQVIGKVKFMYQLGMIDGREYRYILKRLEGCPEENEEIEEVEI